jgi:hypothetical protein
LQIFEGEKSEKCSEIQFFGDDRMHEIGFFFGRRMRAEDGDPLLALFPKNRGAEAKISFSTRK